MPAVILTEVGTGIPCALGDTVYRLPEEVFQWA